MLRRPALALVLALILAVVSQTSAVARSMTAAPGMEVTLCTGDGAVTVVLDTQGNPVQPLHHCPACIVALSLPPEGAAPARPAQDISPASPAAVPLLPARAPLRTTPPARASPLTA